MYSKLGNIQLANEYANRLRDSGVVSVSLRTSIHRSWSHVLMLSDPGNIATDLTRHTNWIFRKMVWPPLHRNVLFTADITATSTVPRFPRVSHSTLRCNITQYYNG